MTKSQGGQANKTGSALERLVPSTLTTRGFVTMLYREYRNNPEAHGSELLLRHVPYTTLYGTNGHTEFLLLSERYNLRTRIECKWQQQGGSVDEKLPYTYLSCIEAMPESHIIILIDGNGFRPGAKEWLRKAAKEKRYFTADNKHKYVDVMDTVEFMTWANNTFK